MDLPEPVAEQTLGVIPHAGSHALLVSMMWLARGFFRQLIRA
jgi:hypothetical protein